MCEGQVSSQPPRQVQGASVSITSSGRVVFTRAHQSLQSNSAPSKRICQSQGFQTICCFPPLVFLIDFTFQRIVKVTAKSRGRGRDFPRAPCPHACGASPINSAPRWSSSWLQTRTCADSLLPPSVRGAHQGSLSHTPGFGQLHKDMRPSASVLVAFLLYNPSLRNLI